MKDTVTNNRRRGALLIDADNIAQRHVSTTLNVAIEHSDASVRRAYANYATGNMIGWEHAALNMGITCEQVSNNVRGKNSTDIALVIDAMDLAHQGVEVFTIASSDSDYTRLATKLREMGCEVIVCGTTDTPISLRSAAKHFVLLGEGNEPDDEETPKQPKGNRPETALSALHTAGTHAVESATSLVSATRLGQLVCAKLGTTVTSATDTRMNDIITFLEDTTQAAGGKIHAAILADKLHKRYGAGIVSELGLDKFKTLVQKSKHLRMDKHLVRYV